MSPSTPLTHSSISRRTFMELSGAAWIGSMLGAGQLPRPAPSPTRPQDTPRPNFLIIVTDQERAPCHWPAGWAEANLPHRTRLAANGLTFRRAYCNSTMCSPSRATFFTGMYSAHHGVTHTLTYGGSQSPSETPLLPGTQTWGQMLADAGYQVVLKGKWHISKGADGGVPTAADVASFGFQQWEPTTAGEGQNINDYGGGCADWDTRITQQAVSFLQSQTAETTANQPFALVVGLVNPHDVIGYPNDWDSTTEPDCSNYAAIDLDQGIGLPPSNSADTLDNKPTCHAESRNLYAVGLGTLLSQQDRLNYVNFYAALHKLVDVHIGTLLDALDESVRDQTIVILTADHGEAGLSHNGLRQKMFNAYEEVIHIPLVISNPVRFPTPQTTDAYAALVDLMPTLASLASVPSPERWKMQGVDLSPILANPATSVQDAILFVYDDEDAGLADGMLTVNGQPIVRQPNHIRALRLRDPDGEWLYARYFDPDAVEAEQLEMYHLTDGNGQEVDLDEIDNLAAPSSPHYEEPFYVAKRAALAQRLAALEEEHLTPHTQFLPWIGTATDGLQG